MTTLTFKVSDEEARLIRFLARQEKVTLSEYLRRRAAGRADPKEATVPRRIRCPRTGALIFAPLENQKPLSTQAVRPHINSAGLFLL